MNYYNLATNLLQEEEQFIKKELALQKQRLSQPNLSPVRCYLFKTF